MVIGSMMYMCVKYQVSLVIVSCVMCLSSKVSVRCSNDAKVGIISLVYCTSVYVCPVVVLSIGNVQ
jgi:hypothetical protein